MPEEGLKLNYPVHLNILDPLKHERNGVTILSGYGAESQEKNGCRRQRDSPLSNACHCSHGGEQFNTDEGFTGFTTDEG